ncbi:thioredoxin H4-like [Rhododendron vialii]|uniref:thioredoxin H4-like n=1 Tax=Rhododendron vialii TaxID=182163 RepID=UPI00265E5FD2|nr:thioredoxin H4-like [Rhododendron vialii]
MFRHLTQSHWANARFFDSHSPSKGGRRIGTEIPAIQQESGPSSAKTTPKKTSQVLEFHSSNKWKAHFEASKANAKLMVIDFTATWCVPCRSMEPVINEFAAKYTDAEFMKIDVDELMGVAQEFGVQTMPTFVLIKKGRVIDKVTGVRKEELQKKIEKHRTN